MGRINRRRDRWLKRAVEFLLRPVFRRPKLPVSQILAEKPRRVLVVRQHNQMGDMLCAVPAFRAIHETLDAPEIQLITAPVNHGIARGNPFVSEVLLFDKRVLRRSPRAVWRFLRELRGFRPDLAIVLNSVSYSGTSSWLAMLSGASRIVGGDSRPFGWSFSSWLYNAELRSGPTIEGHAIDHGLGPLIEVGIRTEDRSIVVVPTPEAQAEAQAFLDGIPRPRVAVHPGAGKAANRWPPERFAEVIQGLRSGGAAVWMVEGPADGDATRETMACLDEPTRQALPVLRGVSLLTVAAALRDSDVALVNDTGVMHVAGAVGVPTLALFGPTPSQTWCPPSPALEAFQSRDGSMAGIEVDRVVQWLRKQLSLGEGLRGKPNVQP